MQKVSTGFRCHPQPLVCKLCSQRTSAHACWSAQQKPCCLKQCYAGVFDAHRHAFSVSCGCQSHTDRLTWILVASHWLHCMHVPAVEYTAASKEPQQKVTDALVPAACKAKCSASDAEFFCFFNCDIRLVVSKCHDLYIMTS